MEAAAAAPCSDTNDTKKALNFEMEEIKTPSTACVAEQSPSAWERQQNEAGTVAEDREWRQGYKLVQISVVNPVDTVREGGILWGWLCRLFQATASIWQTRPTTAAWLVTAVVSVGALVLVWTMSGAISSRLSPHHGPDSTGTEDTEPDHHFKFDMPHAVKCGIADEGAVIKLGCPTGKLIQGVNFASYGLATGTCATGFKTNPICNAPNGTAFVVARCVGKSSCIVAASPSDFGGKDPCLGVKKHLSVSIRCAAGDPPPPPAGGTLQAWPCEEQMSKLRLHQVFGIAGGKLHRPSAIGVDLCVQPEQQPAASGSQLTAGDCAAKGADFTVANGHIKHSSSGLCVALLHENATASVPAVLASCGVATATWSVDRVANQPTFASVADPAWRTCTRTSGCLLCLDFGSSAAVEPGPVEKRGISDMKPPPGFLEDPEAFGQFQVLSGPCTVTRAGTCVGRGFGNGQNRGYGQAVRPVDCHKWVAKTESLGEAALRSCERIQPVVSEPEQCVIRVSRAGVLDSCPIFDTVFYNAFETADAQRLGVDYPARRDLVTLHQRLDEWKGACRDIGALPNPPADGWELGPEFFGCVAWGSNTHDCVTFGSDADAGLYHDAMHKPLLCGGRSHFNSLADREFCTPDGKEGRLWNRSAWGNLSDYISTDGLNPLQACCSCGGGATDRDVTETHPRARTSPTQNGEEIFWNRSYTGTNSDPPIWIDGPAVNLGCPAAGTRLSLGDSVSWSTGADTVAAQLNSIGLLRRFFEGNPDWSGGAGNPDSSKGWQLCFGDAKKLAGVEQYQSRADASQRYCQECAGDGDQKCQDCGCPDRYTKFGDVCLVGCTVKHVTTQKYPIDNLDYTCSDDEPAVRINRCLAYQTQHDCSRAHSGCFWVQRDFSCRPLDGTRGGA